jgi:hypothetical protein
VALLLGLLQALTIKALSSSEKLATIDPMTQHFIPETIMAQYFN